MRNVKMVSHPENATVHKLLDARSHKGRIVAGSSPVLTTKNKKTTRIMTQKNIDQLTDLLNEVNTKLILAKDKIDAQEHIIKVQEEIIEILKSSVQNRDKLIDALEKRIALAQYHIKLKEQSIKQSGGEIGKRIGRMMVVQVHSN